MTEIYLDNAATTRVAPEVAEIAAACMVADYGNPASAHHLGIAAEKRVARAREQLLAALGDPDGRHGDLSWTSGGTESDALGIIGAARARRERTLLVSAIEHPAVRESAGLLEDEGFRVVTLPVTGAGVLDLPRAIEAIEQAGGDLAVVAVMLVNNEIGTVQPIAELARALRERAPRAHLHCDAVQGLGKLAIDTADLGADSLAFAAHKLHGPKGIGALWLRKGSRMRPLWAGGGQQGGLRAGTLAVPGIAALGAAAELAVRDLDEHRRRWAGFADTLRAAANGCGVEVRDNGEGAPRSPHVLSLAFRDLPAEPLLHVLESRGVLVSAGSACSERDRKPSPVLTAIGLDRAFATLRFSFGRFTTAGEVERAAAILPDAVRDLR
jgi:cysteine desulfurase